MKFIDITWYFVVILIGSGLRLWNGPWYHITNPWSIRLLDNFPASWESHLFATRYTVFTSDNINTLDFTEVQIRALIPIIVASIASSFTGEGYWSSSFVELLGWVLASIGTCHIALYLGLKRRIAFVSGLFVATSPLFVSQMWMHVLHLAEFSSMTIGIRLILYAVPWLTQAQDDLRLIQEDSDKIYRQTLVILLTAIGLMFLSFIYVYQNIVFLCIVFWSFSEIIQKAITFRIMIRNLFFCASKLFSIYIIFFVLRSVILVGLEVSGINIVDTGTELSGDPITLLQSNVWIEELIFLNVNAIEMLMRKMTQSGVLLLQSYNMFVIFPTIIGLLITQNTIQKLVIWTSLLTLCATWLYPAPWTAMSAYPVIYICCAIGCDYLSKITSHWIWPRFKGKISQSHMYIWTYLCLVIGMVSVTNRDIVGIDDFARRWWGLYSVTFPS